MKVTGGSKNELPATKTNHILATSSAKSAPPASARPRLTHTPREANKPTDGQTDHDVTLGNQFRRLLSFPNENKIDHGFRDRGRKVKLLYNIIL